MTVGMTLNGWLLSGPPSQSLGVDPVDPAVMRRPPRRKNAPIITKRLLYRVIFSASLIVTGTLFIYTFALEDADVSRREQTMVRTPFVLDSKKCHVYAQL
jgi:Ca2+-transporting ATPase